MDPELILRSINFHGSDLLTALQKYSHNNQLLNFIDQRQIDYFEYHKRAKDARLEDEKKLQKLQLFISQKAPVLFKRNKSSSINMQELDNEDYYAIMPPLEAFMGVPEKERYRYFFECLRKGDIVIGMIHAKQNIGFIIKLVCMDLGKNREIHDAEIKALCPLSQAATMSPHENPLDTYQIKDLIRGVVLDVVPESEKIILSMKNETLPEHLQSTVKLQI